MDTHAAVRVIDRLSVLRDEMGEHPWLIGWQKTMSVTVRDHWSEVEPDELVVCSGDLVNSHVRRWLETRQPALYIGRGYVGNHLFKQRHWWRVTVNGWANLHMSPPPFERWSKMGLPRHPWRVHEVKRVLIAPSKMTTRFWGDETSQEWAERTAERFPGADIKIRYKEGKGGNRWSTLWDDLDWADLVVSQSSAITCEALWWGKKALSTEPCPTWCAGDHSFENWEDPTEPPHRNAWHEHLAWSQYSNQEWENGGALRMLSFYIRNVTDYHSPYQFRFHR